MPRPSFLVVPKISSLQPKPLKIIDFYCELSEASGASGRHSGCTCGCACGCGCGRGRGRGHGRGCQRINLKRMLSRASTCTWVVRFGTASGTSGTWSICTWPTKNTGVIRSPSMPLPASHLVHQSCALHLPFIVIRQAWPARPLMPPITFFSLSYQSLILPMITSAAEP